MFNKQWWIPSVNNTINFGGYPIERISNCNKTLVRWKFEKFNVVSSNCFYWLLVYSCLINLKMVWFKKTLAELYKIYIFLLIKAIISFTYIKLKQILKSKTLNFYLIFNKSTFIWLPSINPTNCIMIVFWKI